VQDIPDDILPLLDAELRRQARVKAPLRQRELDDVAGTWQEDHNFDQAIADQDQVNERLWR
jgi:hypothetical protein